MIFTLFLLDLIFIEIFNFPLYISSLIFLIYKKTKLIFPIIISVFLDIFMSRIYLSLITIIILIISINLNKRQNTTKKLIIFAIIYFIIHMYFRQFNIVFFIKLPLSALIYFLVLKTSLRQYKLLR